MNIAVKSALASAVIALAHACATPVEIVDEVLVANPNDFGDAGPLGGAGGDGQGGDGQGGDGQGAAGSSAGAAAAGIGGTGAETGGSDMQTGLSGSGGLPGVGGAGSAGGAAPGAGGSAPEAGSGGAGGAPIGTGGTGVAAGAGGGEGVGGAGSVGTGGAGAVSVFDPGACDFTDTTGCEALACEASCPTNDGNSCVSRCLPVVECVSDDVASNGAATCVTEGDPLCGARTNGTPNVCTNVVEPAGGPNPAAPTGNGAPQPSFVARQFIECMCSSPRP